MDQKPLLNVTLFCGQTGGCSQHQPSPFYFAVSDMPSRVYKLWMIALLVLSQSHTV